MDTETPNRGSSRGFSRRQLIKKIGAASTAFLTGGAFLSQSGCRSASNPSQPNNQSGNNAPASARGIPSLSRTQMKNMLKQRISWDDPDTFNNSAANWNTVKLGMYYDWDDELVNIVIYETTALAVGMEDRYLPDEVWRNLIDKIGPDKTPDEAIEPMIDASLRARKVTDGEPPSVNRPRSRPTLKSARKPPVRG